MYSLQLILLNVSDGAGTGNVRDRDGDTLGIVSRIALIRHGVDNLDEFVGTNQVAQESGGGAALEEKLVSSSSELAGVVEDGLVLGRRTDLLERGNGHGGEEADDDHDNHDFDEGEALVGTNVFHMNRLYVC